MDFASTQNKAKLDYDGWGKQYVGLWNSSHNKDYEQIYYVDTEWLETAKAFINGGPLAAEFDRYTRNSSDLVKQVAGEEGDDFWLRLEIRYELIPQNEVQLYEEFLVEAAMINVGIFYPQMTEIERSALQSEIATELERVIANKIHFSKASPIEFGEGYLVVHYADWFYNAPSIDIKF